ncbi:hypothetical protein KO506_12835 [Polaribacter vadi]|uniref:hypothetical protein n=1 Tax=Polaribacter TaxID=52959 RepID=UPI001C08A017|nr:MULTISPECIES: hypothetical protein [Polaribacter]MBU3012294.1 hypothetical protein [Polaribacter vadi]MDO6742111.1 hypothetical protein [Polaribacter sp. 1_MG-2023]
MKKDEKEIIFEYLWKTINFFYGVLIIASIFVGIRTLLYFLGRIPEEKTSLSGTLIVVAFIIIYIIFRNLAKPYFEKKINKRK